MTEQAQTTAERIQDMLDMNFNFYPGPPGVTAKTIAAEIDRLTADNAQANQWLVNGVAKIAELEKQRDEAHLLIGKQSDELIRFANLANDYATASQQLAEARAYISTIIDAPGEGG